MSNIKNQTEQMGASDRLTAYTMRVVGLVLAASAIFFLTKDYPASVVADGFFAFGSVLGLVTAAAGWWPGVTTTGGVDADATPPLQAQKVRADG